MVDDMHMLLDRLLHLEFSFYHRDHWGRTPIHQLARRNINFQDLLPWAEILLQRDHTGQGLTYEMLSPLMDDILEYRHLEALASLIPKVVLRPNGSTSVRKIKRPNSVDAQTELLNFLQESYQDVGKVDCYNRNGLHVLADVPFRWTLTYVGLTGGIHDHQGFAKLLIHRGVDFNTYDMSGRPPLIALIKSQHFDDDSIEKVVSQLIERGADIHLRSQQGESGLHVAVKRGRIGATKLLLEHGANVHARRGDGMGVLALGTKNYFRAKENPGLLSRIAACMSLAVDHGAVAKPDLFQEWTQPSNKGKRRT
ncbi:MAG: hypothetical protein M1833_004789 [Piccolia ochrophora]|nr:MAG: hypothetical protein M1833_004789 [Piccolia ochrophora]